MWFPVLINRLRIVPFDLALIVTNFQLILIANEITSGVDTRQDYSLVVYCFDVEDHSHLIWY